MPGRGAADSRCIYLDFIFRNKRCPHPISGEGEVYECCVNLCAGA
jgi:hypothetical protein